jgi:guanylate kinase
LTPIIAEAPIYTKQSDLAQSAPDSHSQPNGATSQCISDAWYSALHEPRPLLVIISGPSGVGKDVTIRRMKERQYPFHFVVTATTRGQRANEVNGVDYHFVSTATFEQMVAADELLEHALVYGQYKGIPKVGVRAALASGRDVIMRIDVQGAATVRRLVPQSISIFLTAESEGALVERLRRRRSDDEEQLKQRLKTACEELQRVNEFQYRVVNRECALDATVDAVLAIMQAEKCRVDWKPVII